MRQIINERGGIIHIRNVVPLGIPPAIQAQLNRIEEKLDQLLRGEKIMTDQLDALTASVAEVESVETSAIALIQGLAAQIEALKDDPAALQALADRLKATDASLAAAVTANTPAPEPAPQPAPEQPA